MTLFVEDKKWIKEEKANELKYNVVCLAYFLKNSCILENCEIFLSNISDMWICFFSK